MAVRESLLDLLDSWLLVQRAERKSPHTLRSYAQAVRSFTDWCAATGREPELAAEAVIGYLADYPGESSTAALHLVILKALARWLAAEEGFDAAPILALRPPKADQKAVPDLPEHEIAAMLKACEGRGLLDRRDKALLSLLVETGLRAAEMVALDVGDIDLHRCVLHVVRGKGGKGRRVRFSLGAAAVVDSYLRARARAVARPSEGPLWINHRGGRLAYRGLAAALTARAEAAGVKGFHLHRLRHTMATRWMRAGGSETGLMAQAGWSSHKMIGRYVRAASEELAADEFDRLGLGITEL